MGNPTCSVEGCEVPAVCRGWCKPHYQSWYRHGDPLTARRIGHNTTCLHPGCWKPTRSRSCDLCEMHYCRRRRGSDLDAPIPPGNPTGICIVDGCLKPTGERRQLCGTHYSRKFRHGDPSIILPRPRMAGPSNPSWKGDNVGYSGAHTRLRKTRGNPTVCAHCGDDAQQWAFNWDSPSMTKIDAATGFGYSTNPNDYIALCLPCHRRFDLAHGPVAAAPQSAD